MIIRAWRGWTTHSNAAAYEEFLRDTMFPFIRSKQIKGFEGISLLRMDSPEEVEFMTLMRFESLESVREFAGQDYEQAVVPPRAQELLARFEPRSRHYQEQF